MVSGEKLFTDSTVPENCAADRLVGIGRLLEQIEHVIVGIVARRADLLHDHLLLAVELVLLEQRVLENVREDIAGERHVLFQHAGKVAGVLHRGRGVEVAANVLDRLGDLQARCATLCP